MAGRIYMDLIIIIRSIGKCDAKKMQQINDKGPQTREIVSVTK